MKLRDIKRTSFVRRWHIVSTAREQTLADHTAQVTMYAHQMYKDLMPSSMQSLGEEHELLLWAMHHDLPEIFVGDLPAPTHTVINGDSDTLKELENQTGNLYRTLAHKHKNSLVGALVKLADVLEAIVWLDSFGIGSQAAKISDYLAGANGKYQSAVLKLQKAFEYYENSSDVNKWAWDFLRMCREDIEEIHHGSMS